jgi:hypothetical protein
MAERRDAELIAQELSEIGNRVTTLENRLSDVLMRLAEAEKVNSRLEVAALSTAQALQEVSRHWGCRLRSDAPGRVGRSARVATRILR